MSHYTIGIDLGTTGTKTVLFDPDRGVVAQAHRTSKLVSSGVGVAEADPAQWLRNVEESIAELLATSGVSKDDVKAVAASGMVPAVIACDAHGHPWRNAILQNDSRAVAEIADLRDQLNAVDLVALTGSDLTQQSVAPTALWLARHEPETWSQTASLVGSYDWILMALGAEAHVEQNWAVESGLFTLKAELIDDVLSAANMQPTVVPKVLRPGDQAGVISAESAERTGLAAGTPLIVGGADHVLSAFAAGVQRPGDWLVKLGGAGDVLVASQTPVVDRRLYLDVHPRPGTWLPNGCMATSGSLIRWYQELIGATDLDVLNKEAAACPPADVMCLPYFLGEKSPLHDPDLRGAFVGLHLGHTRGGLFRSIFEAIAFGFRHHVDVFRDIGLDLGRVMITNGGSKSRLWKQIHAEVLGTEMYPIVEHPGASLGAGLIAAIGVGLIGSWDDVETYVKLDDPVVPSAENIRIYSDAYLQWRELGNALTPISHHMARRARV